MIKLIEYSSSYYNRWNSFVIESNNGTIFHRLDFLKYHGNKFLYNENHILWLKDDDIFAVMPMGVFSEGGYRYARSPYGASYGGVVTKHCLNYSESSQVVKSLISYLREISIYRITITLPGKILERISSDTILFSFLEQGFRIINSDITNVIAFNRTSFESGLFGKKERELERKARKSQRLNVTAKLDQPVNEFWETVVATFKKHKANPTHTFHEWKYLCESFPDHFWNDIAYLNGNPVAGIGHVRLNNYTDSSFYLCSDPRFNKTQALSYLLYKSLLNSQKNGNIWYDLGTSSVNMPARENIFRFKENFGAVGYFRHTIELSL